MQRLLVTILLSIFALPAIAEEKQTSVNPLSAFTKRVYGFQKSILIRSAEKMPEENYSFKPVDTVRTYGQIVGHVAGGQHIFCSLARGETNPARDTEHPKTSKAELIAALNAAFA